MGGVFLGGSLLAAFLAGAVALFAPCCVTVLFPAYLSAAVRNVLLYRSLLESINDVAEARRDARSRGNQ